MTQTGPIVLVLVAGVVLFAHAVAGRATGPESITPSELSVLVTETPERVRLRVLLPEDVPPGSVEVQVPNRLEEGVGEPEDCEVLDGSLAEVVVRSRFSRSERASPL